MERCGHVAAAVRVSGNFMLSFSKEKKEKFALLLHCERTNETVRLIGVLSCARACRDKLGVNTAMEHISGANADFKLRQFTSTRRKNAHKNHLHVWQPQNYLHRGGFGSGDILYRKRDVNENKIECIQNNTWRCGHLWYL